jgi:hypothetical protein
MRRHLSRHLCHREMFTTPLKDIAVGNVTDGAHEYEPEASPIPYMIMCRAAAGSRMITGSRHNSFRPLSSCACLDRLRNSDADKAGANTRTGKKHNPRSVQTMHV